MNDKPEHDWVADARNLRCEGDHGPDVCECCADLPKALDVIAAWDELDAKIKRIVGSDEYKAVWALPIIVGAKYKGETIEKELDACRKARRG